MHWTDTEEHAVEQLRIIEYCLLQRWYLVTTLIGLSTPGVTTSCIPWIILFNTNKYQVSFDTRGYEHNLCNCLYKVEAWKSQDFNGIWTRDLAIPVRRSNQLSYEATGSGFIGS